jgi:hypothetical protein
MHVRVEAICTRVCSCASEVAIFVGLLKGQTFAACGVCLSKRFSGVVHVLVAFWC